MVEVEGELFFISIAHMLNEYFFDEDFQHVIVWCRELGDDNAALAILRKSQHILNGAHHHAGSVSPSHDRCSLLRNFVQPLMQLVLGESVRHGNQVRILGSASFYFFEK